ncbi:hypothetical protein ABIA06_004420 [Bradyrhizobium yuanmingense]|uniref:hypothetical protein n=1 Tax=Bradyrhizobium yuanmingense TaxID=108015 RepID=UPI003511B62E
MDAPTTFACFGIESLGQCSYNPASPGNLYFSLGEVVGALAFTLAAQQLLKQVVIFRLNARYLKLTHVYGLVFLGVGASIVAAIVPNIPALHSGPSGYALNWEMLAALLFVGAYAAIVLALTKPVRVRPDQIEAFAREAARLLSTAVETDYLDFTPDLQRSLPTLIRASTFVQGQRRTTAFYDFLYRNQIRNAAYAASLLRIVADAHYCQHLVSRQAWRVATILGEISGKQLHSRSAEQFVQQLGFQAIMCDESLVAREVGYSGFRAAPFLSESLFSDQFILTRYNPFQSFSAASADEITPEALGRFNDAAERCFDTLIREKECDFVYAAFSIQAYYRSVFMWAHVQQRESKYDHRLVLGISDGPEMAAKMANRLLANATSHEYAALYLNDIDERRHDILQALVEIVYEALCGIANQFSGIDDPFWMLAMDFVHNVFPSIGVQPDGMTPFQQRLAIMIAKKLKHNVTGFYPAVLRVLLANVGPYAHAAGQPNRTAFNLLKDVLYIRLRELKQLNEKNPEKVSDYLPPNVSYSPAINRIVHTYRDGRKIITDISSLQIRAFSLVSPSIHRPLTNDERKAASRRR